MIWSVAGKTQPMTLAKASAPTTWNQYATSVPAPSGGPMREKGPFPAPKRKPYEAAPSPFAGRVNAFPTTLKRYDTDPEYKWEEAPPEGTVVQEQASDFMQGFDRLQIVQKNADGTCNKLWEWVGNGGVRSSDLSALFGLYGCEEVRVLVEQLRGKFALDLHRARKPVKFFTPKALETLVAGGKPTQWGRSVSEADDLRNLRDRMRRQGHYRFLGNKYTRYGTLHEDDALDVLSRATGYKINKSGFSRHPIFQRMGASNDGYIRMPDGTCWLVETKCPAGEKAETPWTQLELGVGVPIQYMPQIQFEMDCEGSACEVLYGEWRRFMGMAAGLVPKDTELLEMIQKLVSWFLAEVVDGRFEMVTAATWLADHHPMRETFLKMMDRLVRRSLSVEMHVVQERGIPPIPGELKQVVFVSSSKKRKAPSGAEGDGVEEPLAKVSRKVYDQRSVEAYFPSEQDLGPLGRAGEWISKRDIHLRGPVAVEEAAAPFFQAGEGTVYHVEYSLTDKEGTIPKLFSNEQKAVRYLHKVLTADNLKGRVDLLSLKRKTARTTPNSCQVERLFEMRGPKVALDHLQLERGPLRGVIVFPVS